MNKEIQHVECNTCSTEHITCRESFDCRMCGEPLNIIENNFKSIEERSDDQKLKKDKGKLRWDLLPIEPIEEIVKVLTFGLEKGYKEESWKEVESKRYEAALMRHFTEYKKGTKLDEESKLSPLSHMLCNVMFLLYKELHEKGIK